MKHLMFSVAFACSVFAASFAAAQTQDRRVTIINETSFDIVKFQGSNVGTDNWEENIFDGSYLPPGASVSVNFDDGSGYCKFDFRAEFSDGEVLVKNGIDVCKLGHFRYID